MFAKILANNISPSNVYHYEIKVKHELQKIPCEPRSLTRSHMNISSRTRMTPEILFPKTSSTFARNSKAQTNNIVPIRIASTGSSDMFTGTPPASCVPPAPGCPSM